MTHHKTRASDDSLAVGDHRLRNIYMRTERHPTLLEEAARSAQEVGAPPRRLAAGEPLRKLLKRALSLSRLVENP